MLLIRLTWVAILCTLAICASGQKNGAHFIDEDATHITKVVHEDGVTQTERLLKTDTGYINDGIREQILADGRRIVEFLKADIQDSVVLSFYPSGPLQLKMSVYQGFVVGPVEKYSPDGKLEGFSWFTDPIVSGKKQEAAWVIVFDSAGSAIGTVGHPINSALMSHNGLEGTGSVSLSFLCAPAPDSMHVVLLISIERSQDKTVDTFTKFIELPSTKTKFLTKLFPFFKEAKYSATYMLFDDRNKLIVSDTTFVENR